MTKNRRYEAHYDALQNARRAAADARPRAATLPPGAYGPNKLEWATGARPPVWAWVQWDVGPATRIPCFATAWNDRVVVVEWVTEHGTVDTVVWRQAVTTRSTTNPHPSRS